MNFDSLDRGEKRDLHLLLYENEMVVLDKLCERYRCSRAAVVGALLREYVNADLEGKVPSAAEPGERARRR